MHVAIVGSGFAGTILARVVRAQGHDTTLIERDAHPRFALGESSTPLAAIALERLAARYGLTDLRALAAYGRWRAALPDVRCGLKRGFTFYRHTVGRPYTNNGVNANRLLVAASPDDGVADTHWFREDVDSHLVERAQDEGVRYLDHTSVIAVEERDDSIGLTLDQRGRHSQVVADFVVDASGAGGAIARHVGSADVGLNGALRTALVYGHFTDVRPLREVAEGVPFPAGPYPDERAAVHHLLEDGWMYELRFDHGVTSAGFVVELGERDWDASVDPGGFFHSQLERYPSLAAEFASARAVRPLVVIPRLQRQRDCAGRGRWALLPHTFMFWSPLFSTGIAWSLAAVERLGLVCEELSAPQASSRHARGLDRYAELLTVEADHLRTLVEAAYRARTDFASFDAVAQVYFAAASYGEAVQRLCDAPNDADGHWAWSGFLGAGDPVLRTALGELARFWNAGNGEPQDLIDAVGRLIAPRNVAGLADVHRHRCYPVDVEALVAAADLLGLRPEEVRSRLSRLRASA